MVPIYRHELAGRTRDLSMAGAADQWLYINLLTQIQNRKKRVEAVEVTGPESILSWSKQAQKAPKSCRQHFRSWRKTRYCN